MIAITNGKIITENKILEGYDLIIEGQEIHAIISITKRLEQYAFIECVDANGGYISPGFIDIHADYIEHIAAPRPTSLMDFRLAIREAERELLTHGVTTMFHSLSLYKEKQADHKPIRKQENVRKLVDLIANTHHTKHLIRHRFHARFEIDNIHSVNQILEYIEEGKVDLLSFMDHTPGQGQYRDIKGYKDMTRHYGNQMNEADLDAFVRKQMGKIRLSNEDCKKIADLAKEKGIAIASHDDDTIEKLEMIQSFGTTISEFPITMEVAKKAHEMGFYTAAGAPNVLLNGSHSGNLCAHEAIAEGVIDILCSDYYPASMLHAIFKLHKDFSYPLEEVFRLVTINPAKAVKMDHIVGSLTQGKRADIIIIEIIDLDFPVITSCFVDGEHVFQTRYRS